MLTPAIVGVTAFLSGYAWGKQRGQHKGFQAGMAHCALELREKSLECGYCLLCAEKLVIVHDSFKEPQRE